MTTEPIELLYARLDERLKAIERDVRDVRVEQAAARAREDTRRPQWPAIVAAVVAVAALIVTLAINL